MTESGAPWLSCHWTPKRPGSSARASGGGRPAPRRGLGIARCQRPASELLGCREDPVPGPPARLVPVGRRHRHRGRRRRVDPGGARARRHRRRRAPGPRYAHRVILGAEAQAILDDEGRYIARRTTAMRELDDGTGWVEDAWAGYRQVHEAAAKLAARWDASQLRQRPTTTRFVRPAVPHELCVEGEPCRRIAGWVHVWFPRPGVRRRREALP